MLEPNGVVWEGSSEIGLKPFKMVFPTRLRYVFNPQERDADVACIATLGVPLGVEGVSDPCLRYLAGCYSDRCAYLARCPSGLAACM